MPLPRVTPLPCGCIPHEIRPNDLWGGIYCDTEKQGYCNFECPHDEFWEEYSNTPLTDEEILANLDKKLDERPPYDE